MLREIISEGKLKSLAFDAWEADRSLLKIIDLDRGVFSVGGVPINLSGEDLEKAIKMLALYIRARDGDRTRKPVPFEHAKRFISSFQQTTIDRPRARALLKKAGFTA